MIVSLHSSSYVSTMLEQQIMLNTSNISSCFHRIIFIFHEWSRRCDENKNQRNWHFSAIVLSYHNFCSSIFMHVKNHVQWSDLSFNKFFCFLLFYFCLFSTSSISQNKSVKFHFMNRIKWRKKKRISDDERT